MCGLAMNDVVKALMIAATAIQVHHMPTTRTCQLPGAAYLPRRARFHNPKPTNNVISRWNKLAPDRTNTDEAYEPESTLKGNLPNWMIWPTVAARTTATARPAPITN